VPIYQPLDVGAPLKASLSDLVNFQWTNNGVSADFILPDDDAHLLRVAFDRECIVRLLDEMPLSTENDMGPVEGLISENFAYSVEGAAFSQAQSEAWKLTVKPATHYRFITGWTCLDVLSQAVPSFTVIARSPQNSIA
jgi:hypothetical protein